MKYDVVLDGLTYDRPDSCKNCMLSVNLRTKSVSWMDLQDDFSPLVDLIDWIDDPLYGHSPSVWYCVHSKRHGRYIIDNENIVDETCPLNLREVV